MPVAAGLPALLALGLAGALVRARSRTERELRAARAETAALRSQLEALEHQVVGRVRTPAETEFVITHLGEEEPEQTKQPTPEIGAPLFADLVLRETVVKAASLAYGVRRALDPETRTRIRFEMRREIRRARKQRRADDRQARREWQARQRAAMGEEGSAA